jgi:glycosyltransferase involved in cell wall biosynthesis
MTPRVSIGLPVFNGENYLGDAIQSILDQTFEDFDLIIRDNASTDRSLEMARDFAQADKRISIDVSETNLGAPENFNRVFASASGDYFRWAAHDDVLQPTYLARCVEILDNCPDYVMSHSKVQIINDDGAVLRDYAIVLENVQSENAAERFSDMILVPHACYDAFALMRRGILSKTPLIGAYLSSDRCLLGEMMLHGKHYIVPEFLYRNREHGDRSVRIPNHERARKWFRQSGKRGLVLPAWRLLEEYRRAVERSPLSSQEKRECKRVIRSWARKNWRLLRGDLRIAASQVLSRTSD